MMPGASWYSSRLTILTVLLFTSLAVPPLALGYALAGLEFSVAFVSLSLLLSFWRAPQFSQVSGAIPLAWHQAPGLFTLVESLARGAGLRQTPEVHLVPGGQVNAAAFLSGRSPVLVVTESLLARLDTRHLRAVLAHETAHLAHWDLVLFRLARTLQATTLVLGVSTLVLAIFSVPFAPQESLFWSTVAGVSPLVSRFTFAALSRTREFAADWGAARLTGDPAALAESLELIEYRPRTWWDWLTGRRSPAPLDPAEAAFRTHPPTPDRIRRLDLMARPGY